MAKRQGDLFGGIPKEPDPRGWTELDRVRRRYFALEKKILSGDYNSNEMEEFSTLRAQICIRESEARTKWASCFRK